MSNITERALSQVFMNKLRDKPLDKITVQELTEECDLTRNTFYYHFKDVYDLLAYVFTTELNRLQKKYVLNNDWQGGLEEGMKYLYAHKKAVRNIWDTIRKDEIIKYIYQVSHNHAMVIVSLQSKSLGINLFDEIKVIVAEFYRDALVGNLINWISDDMKAEPKKLAKRYNLLFKGTFESVVKTAKEIVN